MMLLGNAEDPSDDVFKLSLTLSGQISRDVIFNISTVLPKEIASSK